ncbi:hypothetical protein XELAEV_18020655mg [Xenopus laevis]|uniref:Uncharacterized protein n=1 Tax=Xenopus laevis TaxID=8355 RepID=A0A974D928_XENLA|nr:hypothetical protein XELAEV_18020655mg [Xenopus laevis]
MNMTSVQQSTSGSTAEKGQDKNGHPCVNPGNPVFSCMATPVTPTNHMFQAKQQNMLFKTSSSEYGALLPTYEMAPCSHHPVSQRFSQHLGQCGMYRNHSFNTMIDRSKVHDCPNLQYTL